MLVLLTALESSLHTCPNTNTHSHTRAYCGLSPKTRNIPRSLEEELHMLLPVLLAHAPRIRMREVSAALLRTRFAPSLLHVSAMNDPLSLER